MGAETAVLLAFARPGTTVALAEGAYFGTSRSDPRARALGPHVRRVRPDRHAARRRHRLGRVAGEPGADRARLGGAARASGPRRLRRDGLDAGLPAARSTRAPTSSSTRRRSSSPAATTRCSAPPSRATRRTRRGCARSRTHAGIMAAPDAARAAPARARLARAPHAPDHRDGDASWRAASTSIRRWSASATRASPALISFDVADPRAVETATRLIRTRRASAASNSTMESRHRWEGDRIPRGLLRLSVGLEDVEELWADLDGRARRGPLSKPVAEAKAVGRVVVHQADRLHERVTDGRADEAEAALLHVRERARERSVSAGRSESARQPPTIGSPSTKLQR